MTGIFGVVIIILLIGGVYVFGILTNKSSVKDSDNKNIDLTSDLAIKIISFIIPLVGFIFGSISFSKESRKDKELGMKCILLGLLAVIVWFLIFVLN